MLTHPLAELTPAMLRNILAGALADIQFDDDDDDDGAPSPGAEPPGFGVASARRFARGLRGARFGTVAAALIGDVASLPALLDLRRAMKGLDDEGDFDDQVMMMAVARLAWRAPPPLELLDHPSARLRRGIAHGLRPTSPEAIAQLERLALDLDPCVRATARRRLPAALRPAWWAGTFESEPDAAPELVESLARFDELWLKEPRAGFVAAWSRLPDAARAFSAPRLYSPLNAHRGLTEPFVGALMSVAGGEVGLVELLRRFDGDRQGSELDYVLRKTPIDLEPARRQALATALSELLRTSPVGDDYHGFDARGAAARLLVRVQGDALDPSAIVELALAIATRMGPGYGGRSGIHELLEPLRGVPLPAFDDQLRPAWMAGFPHPWTRLENGLAPQFWARLTPDERSGIADALMASDDDALRERGLRLAISCDVDVAALAADPRHAGSFAPGGALGELHFAAHRAALRAGSAAPQDVLRTIDRIHFRYGGRLELASYEMHARSVSPPRPDDGRVPAELAGPWTADEEASYRRALAEVLATTEDPSERLMLLADDACSLGPGAWAPGERERLQAVIEPLIAASESHDEDTRSDARGRLGYVAVVLARKGEPSDMPWLTRIAATTQDDNLSIGEALAFAQHRLGAVNGLRAPRRTVPTHTPAPLGDDGPSSLPGLPLELARRVLARLGLWDDFDMLEILEPSIRLASDERRDRASWLRTCAAELVKGAVWALADDPSPETWRGIARVVELDDEERASLGDLISGAMDDLLDGTDPSAPAFHELLRSGSVTVRRALANGLDASRPEARVHLFTLLDDRDRTVRTRAQEALAGYELPWWRGPFSRDPLAAATPDEAAQLAPVFARLHELLGARGRDWRALAALLPELPAAAALDLVPRITGTKRTELFNQVPILAALLGLPDGYRGWREVIARARDADDEAATGRIGELVGAHIREHDAALRDRVLPQVIAALARVPVRDHVESDPMADADGALLGALWSPELDPSRLLDDWLARRSAFGPYSRALSRIFEGAAWRPEWQATRRLVEGARQGFGAPWRAWTDTKLLGRLPSETRSTLVDELERSADRHCRAWALNEILLRRGMADEDVDARLAELVADDDSRALVLGDTALGERARPLLLARVRAGVTKLSEATSILNRAGAPRDEEALAVWRRLWREQVALFAGPHPERVEVLRLSLHDLIEDDERTFWARVVEDGTEHEALNIMYRLRYHGGREDLPLARRIVQRFEDPDLRRSLRELERRLGGVADHSEP